MTIEDFESKNEEEATKIIQSFTTALEIDEEVAQLLVEHGFSSLEEVAYVPKEELLEIEAFDEEIVDELRNRANDTLLTQALLGGKSGEGDADLASMEGVTPALLECLIAAGITTRDDLAELAVDELLDVPDMTEEKAGALIMKAREAWFKSDDTSEA